MIQKDGWRVWVVCLVLALGTFALYFPALRFDFVNLDDRVYVANNPHVNKGLAGVFGWAFQAGYENVWQPLTWISYALDCQIYGPKPGGLHATNVILHALNSVLVFLVLRALTGAFWRSAAVAAFFAWHPLHVEVAAWIAERKGLLCAFFTLLSLWAYARYARHLKSQISNFKFYYVGAIVLFALALMSKPAAVTLPVLLLLLDWWPLGRLAATAERPVPRKALTLLVEKIPFFVLSIASCICTVMAARLNHLMDPVTGLPFKMRLVSAVMAYFRYLSKSFWPSDLGVFYSFAFHRPAMELIGVGLLLAAISIAAIRGRSSRPYWLVGWLWFLVALLPTMDLVQAGSMPMSDRYMYIPSIGLWMLVCWEACDLAAPYRGGKAVLGGLCVVLLAACAAASSVQLRCWRNEGSLLARIAEPDSNAYAHAAYAEYLLQHNQLALAEEECQQAIAINPSKLDGPLLLAKIYYAEGKYDSCIRLLENVLQAAPGLDMARQELAMAFLANKHPAEAAKEFLALIQRQPKDFEAYHFLAQASLMQGKAADAAAQLRASLKLKPDQPDTLNDLAWLLATDPHAEIRQGAEAVKLASRACALTRDQAPVLLGTLAAAYAETGDFEKAAATAKKAHDLAAAQGRKAVADKNLQLLELYRSHKPDREKQ